MSSKWQQAARSSLCEVTSIRIKLDAKHSESIPINCIDFAMACEVADRLAAMKALAVFRDSIGPLIAAAITRMLPEAATVNIKTKDSVLKEIPVGDVAQHTLLSGLSQERIINNPTCEVRDVPWRTYGLTKGKEQGNCILQLVQSGAQEGPGADQRKGNGGNRRSTSSAATFSLSPNVTQVR